MNKKGYAGIRYRGRKELNKLISSTEEKKKKKESLRLGKIMGLKRPAHLFRQNGRATFRSSFLKH